MPLRIYKDVVESRGRKMHIIYYARQKADFVKPNATKHMRANIQYVVTDDEITIIHIEVAPDCRRQGYGTSLLRAALFEHRKCPKVTLDDMSDGATYCNDGEGFYQKCGFQYIVEGEPEMEADPETVWSICRRKTRKMIQ